MTPTPIRVATAVLSERIFAGRPTKDGKGFKEPRYDVTSDVLLAVKDKIGIGNEITVECDGVPLWRIAVLATDAPTISELLSVIKQVDDALASDGRLDCGTALACRISEVLAAALTKTTQSPNTQVKP